MPARIAAAHTRQARADHPLLPASAELSPPAACRCSALLPTCSTVPLSTRRSTSILGRMDSGRMPTLRLKQRARAAAERGSAAVGGPEQGGNGWVRGGLRGQAVCVCFVCACVASLTQDRRSAT